MPHIPNPKYISPVVRCDESPNNNYGRLYDIEKLCNMSPSDRPKGKYYRVFGGDVLNII